MGKRLVNRKVDKQNFPRQVLLREGPFGLGDDRLIAVLLRIGTAGNPVETLAKEFCEFFCNDLTLLRQYSHDEIWQMVRRAQRGDCDRGVPMLRGIGRGKLYTLLAAQEFGARIYLPKVNIGAEDAFPRDSMRFAESVAEIFLQDASRYNREGFWVLHFDRGRHLLDLKDGPHGTRIIEPYLLTLGVGAHTVIDASTLFRRAVMIGADRIVLAHNHPSGNVTPSDADIETTRSLIRAGRTLGIPIEDHIIVGRPDRTPGFCSFRVRDICSFDVD